MTQYSGVVKWFNNAKGFGFLGRNDGPDVFCHYSSIQNDGYKPERGRKRRLNIVTGEKGPQLIR